MTQDTEQVSPAMSSPASELAIQTARRHAQRLLDHPGVDASAKAVAVVMQSDLDQIEHALSGLPEGITIERGPGGWHAHDHVLHEGEVVPDSWTDHELKEIAEQYRRQAARFCAVLSARRAAQRLPGPPAATNPSTSSIQTGSRP